MTVLTLNKRIEEKQKEIEALIALRDEAITAEEPATPAQKLAIYLHESTCRLNHIDQCGWDYEIKDGVHDWERPAHTTMLRRATEIVDKFGYDLGVSILNSGLFK